MAACPHGLPHNVATVQLPEWEEHFIRYYCESRKLPRQAIEETLAMLKLPGPKSQALIEMAKKQLDELGNDAVGGLGEAHLSYHLENTRGVVLTRATWKHDPFAHARGIDLVGVHITQLLIWYVESKTSQSNEAFIKKKTLEGLRKELLLSRLEQKFQGKVGHGAYSTVLRTLRQLIREGRVPSGLEANAIRLDKTRFSRMGAVVVGSLEPWNPILEACPCDYAPDRPCELLLLLIESLGDKLARLVAIESGAGEAEVDV